MWPNPIPPRYSDDWSHKVYCPKQGRGIDSFSFYWHIIALRCCISFCCPRESAICVHMSPPSGTSLPPLCVTTEHRAELPMLYSRFPLAICFTRGSIHTSIIISQFVLPSPPPPHPLTHPFSPAASLFLRAWFLWDGNPPAAAWPPVTPTWQNNGLGPPPPPPTVRWQGGSGGEVAQEVTDVPAFRALGNLFKISDASYPKIIS